MFRCCIKLSSSMFVLILQVPSFILVGPNIFLSILLSNTESFLIIFSLRTHVSQPYVTIGLIIDQYNFSLYFLDTNLLHSKTLPILNKVIIKFTVHCIVHLQCTVSLSLSLFLSLVFIKVRDSDGLT